MKTFIIILCFCFFCSGDDPPKEKKVKEDSNQVQRSLNLKELKNLKKSYDTLVLKQDTLVKKK